MAGMIWQAGMQRDSKDAHTSEKDQLDWRGDIAQDSSGGSIHSGARLAVGGTAPKNAISLVSVSGYIVESVSMGVKHTSQSDDDTHAYRIHTAEKRVTSAYVLSKIDGTERAVTLLPPKDAAKRSAFMDRMKENAGARVTLAVYPVSTTPSMPLARSLFLFLSLSLPACLA